MSGGNSQKRVSALLYWEVHISQLSNSTLLGYPMSSNSKTFSSRGACNNLSWSLELAPRCSSSRVYFNLYSKSIADLRDNCPVSGDARIELIVPPDYSIYDIRTSEFNIDSVNNLGDCGVSFRFDFSKIKKMASEDRFLIRYTLDYSTMNDAFTIDKRNASLANIAEGSLSRDLEKIAIADEQHFSDVTISVGDKNYPCHKAILSSRCSVFNAMLKSEMKERLKNHITIEDIDQGIFEEMLHYIYTGKVKNLEESALVELLPVADKYDLVELKNVCEGRLISKLSAHNVGNILVMADMHNAEELKMHALRFIKMNYVNRKDIESTQIWNVLTESRPALMKEMLAVFFKN